MRHTKFSLILIIMDHGSSNLSQMTRPDQVIITQNKTKQKKKQTPKPRQNCRIGYFAESADHKVKIKENDNRQKYSNLGRELKKLCIMKGMVIPIVISALGSVTKSLFRVSRRN